MDTKEMPRWALDAANAVVTESDDPAASYYLSVPQVASIIVRYAPQDVCVSHSILDQSASEAKEVIGRLFKAIDNLMSDRDNIRDRVFDKLAAKDVRIDELQAENARLRERLERISNATWVANTGIVHTAHPKYSKQ